LPTVFPVGALTGFPVLVFHMVVKQHSEFTGMVVCLGLMVVLLLIFCHIAESYLLSAYSSYLILFCCRVYFDGIV